jgi:release factor glutamine methyltransferase
VKLLEALFKAQSTLENLGQDNPRGQAEWMLEHLLKMERSELYHQSDLDLAPEQVDSLREYLRRRKSGEPLQYILGQVDFHHITLKVDQRALIPRPETEGLVALAIATIRDIPAPKFLDVGTGSGAIALALLHDHAGAIGVACDNSSDALQLALENAKCLGTINRITFIEADLFAPEFSALVTGRFDLIVSNPPYVSQGEYEQLHEEIRDWEPAHALQSGPEGLDAIRKLAAVGGDLINPTGRLIIEIGELQSQTAADAFHQFGWETSVVLDLNKKPRYLTASHAGNR